MTDSGPRQRLVVALIVLEGFLRHHQGHLIQVRGLIFYGVSERAAHDKENQTWNGCTLLETAAVWYSFCLDICWRWTEKQTTHIHIYIYIFKVFVTQSAASTSNLTFQSTRCASISDGEQESQDKKPVRGVGSVPPSLTAEYISHSHNKEEWKHSWENTYCLIHEATLTNWESLDTRKQKKGGRCKPRLHDQRWHRDLWRKLIDRKTEKCNNKQRCVCNTWKIKQLHCWMWWADVTCCWSRWTLCTREDIRFTTRRAAPSVAVKSRPFAVVLECSSLSSVSTLNKPNENLEQFFLDQTCSASRFYQNFKCIYEVTQSYCRHWFNTVTDKSLNVMTQANFALPR